MNWVAPSNSMIIHLQEAVEKVAIVIKEACEGLVSFLRQLRDCNKEASLYDLVRAEMNSMKELDWLAPPMLSRR